MGGDEFTEIGANLEQARVVFSRRDGRVLGELTRAYAHPIQVVWSYLTEPEKVALWMAPGAIELRVGGAAKLNFVNSGVVVDSLVTELSLSISIPEHEDPGRGCAGWESHLDMLAAALEGVSPRFPVELFFAKRDAYRLQLAV